MVAFAPTAEFSVRTAPRARGQDRTRTICASRRSKSSTRPLLRRSSPGRNVRLESCSKDPIRFEGGFLGLYVLVGGRPMTYGDPSGLSSTMLSGSCLTESSTSVTYSVTCQFDMPGWWWGTSRRRIRAPLTGGNNPLSTCLEMGIDGFVGYQVYRTTTTRSSRCSPCLGVTATTFACNPSLPGPGGAIKACTAATVIGVAVIASTLPRVDIDVIPIDIAPPTPRPKWPTCPGGQCLCCEIQTGNQQNIGSIIDTSCECKDPAECWADFPFSACVPPNQPPGKPPMPDERFPPP
ncbi:hypothetical protein Q31a_42080 [Aureliella helgolandensis]|uniref:Uncharacterized protein n=1 Tax=Aureliella helgolandensis TaxID=2527968 RepID=A0A518GBH0_9BACT|nr:hypothetical protein Q31a_42080 [Aureliella helgolandensis]